MALLPPAIEQQPLPSLAPMLEKVLPAVVNISTTTSISTSQNPLFREPFFRQFAPRRRQQSTSLGSGVIVDAKNGYILTNHHVIAQADAITITTNDGRAIEARVVGSDPGSDVAVIQVVDANLSALAIGQSKALRVGDFVVAIGNPFGLGQTATSGIVSALGRTGLGIEGYEDFIQTDASINPGNSGGALVNLRGQLIGINTAILSRGGGSVGIGLSIPIDMANTLMAQLIKYGDIQRGLLGVVMQDLTPQLAQAFNLAGKKGAVVSEVIKGSAAADIGMAAGDVIVGFNRSVIKSSADLRNAIGLLRAGETGVVEYYRHGKLFSKQVFIKGAEEIARAQSKNLHGTSLEGATLENVTAAKSQQHGIQVAKIEPKTPAAASGLEQGDVILSVNNTRVATVEELGKVVAKHQQVLLIRLIRDNRQLMLVAR